MNTVSPATAGQRLRTTLDEALVHASRSLGRQLEWSEIEAYTIDQAALVADRGERIRTLIGAELDSQHTRPSVIVKLSAEARLCERQTLDFIARVNPGLGEAKWPNQQGGASAHWHPSRGASH